MQKLSPISLSFHSKSRALLSMIILVAAFAGSASAQSTSGAHAQLMQLVDQNAPHWKQVSKQIW